MLRYTQLGSFNIEYSNISFPAFSGDEPGPQISWSDSELFVLIELRQLTKRHSVC